MLLIPILLVLVAGIVLPIVLFLKRKHTNINYKRKEVPEVEEYKLKDKELEKLSASFVSQDEKFIASLGNGYIMNYLANKSVEKGFAFITDKRVYFKGSCLSGTGEHLVKTNEERTVDVKNITGSGFTYHRYWGILVALLISIMVTLAVAFFSAGFSWVFCIDRADSMGRELKVANEISTLLNDADYVSIGLDMDDDELEAIIVSANKKDEYRVYIFGDISRTDIDLEVEYYDYATDDKDEYDLTLNIDKETLKKIEECKTNEERIKFFRKLISKTGIISEYILGVVLSGFAGIVSPLLFLALTITSCINFKKYLLSRKTLFRIEYAGGCIAFDVSFYAKAEIDDFQKQLRRAKDMAEESTAIKSATTESPMDIPTQNSSVDDLRKYAELLKDGLITQEEYDAMKKKVLGL